MAVWACTVSSQDEPGAADRDKPALAYLQSVQSVDTAAAAAGPSHLCRAVHRGHSDPLGLSSVRVSPDWRRLSGFSGTHVPLADRRPRRLEG